MASEVEAAERTHPPVQDESPRNLADPAALLDEVDALIDAVQLEAARQLESWSAMPRPREEFAPGAENLAAYLALRHHDLRPLQRRLMALGLSSLGRLENRVMPTLETVRGALRALCGAPWAPGPAQRDFFAGERQLASNARALFGPPAEGRGVALLVTCPSEAAADPAFMRRLAERDVEAVRINCAHDEPEDWRRMIRHVRAAEAATGRRIRIFMDLAGPKIRTGAVRELTGEHRVREGHMIAIVAPGALHRPLPPDIAFAAECTLPEVIAAVRPGQRLFIDDGRIAARIETVQHGIVTALVTRCKADGAKLKPEKGLNVPDSALDIAALTAKDREDLAFIAQHADGIEFSFVQSVADVAMLQEALAQVRPQDWRNLALILKIETARAVGNLPDILVRAASQQPVAIMIARGDLAIEIGYARLAEMQEEILWIGEAAQVPVIWATQVLEQLVKAGLPSRGELTDAAMAGRADCVMLNKGPYLIEAIDALSGLLGRMGEHVRKKTPQLRRLHSW